MVTIRNASPAGRGLPGGPTLRPGHSVILPGVDWAEMAGHPVIAFWIASGDLVVTDDEPMATRAETGDTAPASDDNADAGGVSQNGADVNPAPARAKKG